MVPRGTSALLLSFPRRRRCHSRVSRPRRFRCLCCYRLHCLRDVLFPLHRHPAAPRSHLDTAALSSRLHLLCSWAPTACPPPHLLRVGFLCAGSRWIHPPRGKRSARGYRMGQHGRIAGHHCARRTTGTIGARSSSIESSPYGCDPTLPQQARCRPPGGGVRTGSCCSHRCRERLECCWQFFPVLHRRACHRTWQGRELRWWVLNAWGLRLCRDAEC